MGTGVLCVAVASVVLSAQRPTATTPSRAAQSATASQPAAARPTPVTSRTPAVQDHNAVLKRYCLGCHNEKLQGCVGGLSLSTSFDVAKAADHSAVSGEVIRSSRRA